MATFFGDYPQTIDAKRRLPITSALRELVDPKLDGDNFILLVGPENRLWLYPDKYCLRLIAAMKRRGLSAEEHRQIALYFATGRLLKPDAQGRVVLPDKSIKRASVPERVTLVGIDDHIEVWTSDEWDARVEKEVPKLADELYEAAKLLSDRDEMQ